MKSRYFASEIHLGTGTTVDQLSWIPRHVRIDTLTSQLKGYSSRFGSCGAVLAAALPR
jgi:hypothetical protein